MMADEKIAMLTAYDYSMAGIESQKGIDMILVGDSAHFILNGRNTTRGITMNEMTTLAERVCNGVRDYGGYSLVVGDLPDGSYGNVKDAVANAKEYWDVGVDAVKLEGGIEKPYLNKVIQAIIREGIPVQGHIGYTPQSKSHVDRGHVQGKTQEGIQKILEDYSFLTEAGVFSVVLECVPYQVSQLITESAQVPSIGIGAGPYCHGQVLVVYDFLGLSPGTCGQVGKMPKFVWGYNDCDAPTAIERYVKAVKGGEMPDLAHSYKLSDTCLLDKFRSKNFSFIAQV